MREAVTLRTVMVSSGALHASTAYVIYVSVKEPSRACMRLIVLPGMRSDGSRRLSFMKIGDPHGCLLVYTTHTAASASGVDTYTILGNDRLKYYTENGVISRESYTGIAL